MRTHIDIAAQSVELHCCSLNYTYSRVYLLCAWVWARWGIGSIAGSRPSRCKPSLTFRVITVVRIIISIIDAERPAECPSGATRLPCEGVTCRDHNMPRGVVAVVLGPGNHEEVIRVVRTRALCAEVSVSIEDATNKNSDQRAFAVAVVACAIGDALVVAVVVPTARVAELGAGATV